MDRGAVTAIPVESQNFQKLQIPHHLRSGDSFVYTPPKNGGAAFTVIVPENCRGGDFIEGKILTFVQSYITLFQTKTNT
jgi:hypothetical protein